MRVWVGDSLGGGGDICIYSCIQYHVYIVQYTDTFQLLLLHFLEMLGVVDLLVCCAWLNSKCFFLGDVGPPSL